MEYEDLRRVQRTERANSRLSDVGDDFYTGLSSLVNQARQKYEAGHSIDDLRSLENILKIARDIIERREQKIAMRVLRSLRSSDGEEDTLAKEEKALSDGLGTALRGNRRVFEQVLTGDYRASGQKQPAAAAGEDLNIVLVRTIKKVPKFVGSDSKEYGPFEANEVIKLPQKEADLLSKGNFIEVI